MLQKAICDRHSQKAASNHNCIEFRQVRFHLLRSLDAMRPVSTKWILAGTKPSTSRSKYAKALPMLGSNLYSLGFHAQMLSAKSDYRCDAMPRRLTFRQIEAFRAAMLTGSITEGAELICLTQPAVSRLIADLESAVNLRLFERRGNRIVATTEGILLYQEVEKSFSGLDRIERAASDIGSNWRGTVRVIAMAGPAIHFLPQLISTVMRNHADAFFISPPRWRPSFSTASQCVSTISDSRTHRSNILG